MLGISAKSRMSCAIIDSLPTHRISNASFIIYQLEMCRTQSERNGWIFIGISNKMNHFSRLYSCANGRMGFVIGW